jgi:hypothetical protein
MPDVERIAKIKIDVYQKALKLARAEVDAVREAQGFTEHFKSQMAVSQMAVLDYSNKISMQRRSIRGRR